MIRLCWVSRGKIFGRATVVLGQEYISGDVRVPRGFRTDGASLPWFVRAFLPPLGDYFPAAVVHDWLLVEGRVSREDAAHVFKGVLKELEMPEWLVNTFYWGVRANDRWQEFKGKVSGK